MLELIPWCGCEVVCKRNKEMLARVNDMWVLSFVFILFQE